MVCVDYYVPDGTLIIAFVAAERAFDVAFGTLFGGGFAFIVEFFTLTQTDLNFQPAVDEIGRQRNDGITLLFDQTEQTHDLTFVHEQFACTHRIAVKNIALVIGGNMHTVQQQFTVFDHAIGILEIEFALANGFDFRAAQFNTGFVGFHDKIFMISLTVGGNRVFVCLFSRKNPSFPIRSLRLFLHTFGCRHFEHGKHRFHNAAGGNAQ